MVFLAKGRCSLGRRQIDQDGNVVNETAAQFTTDPNGGCVAVGVLDDDTLEVTQPAEVFGDFQPWHFLSYALKLLKPTRRGNIPDFKAITTALAAQEKWRGGICPFCDVCSHTSCYCDDCIVTEWLNAEDDQPQDQSGCEAENQ